MQTQHAHPALRLGKGGRLGKLVDAQGSAQGGQPGEQVVPGHRRVAVVEPAVRPAAGPAQHRLGGVERNGLLQDGPEGLSDTPSPVRRHRAHQEQEGLGEVHEAKGSI